MKKMIIILIWLSASSLGALAQVEGIVSLGGDLLRGKDKMRGDNELFTASFLCGKPELRFGSFIQGLWSYSFTTDDIYKVGYYYRTRDLTIGLAVDSRKKGNLTNRYLWLNTGLRFSRESGWDNTYEASQNDYIFYVAGGVSFVSILQGWFGYNTVFFEAQEPIGKGTRDVGYNSDTLRNQDYFNKERMRLVGEAGVKQIAFFLGQHYLAFTPLVHLGYGWETGTRKQFFEVGAGIALGYFDKEDVYVECFKLKAYNLQGVNYQRIPQTAFPNSWVIDLTITAKVPFKK